MFALRIRLDFLTSSFARLCCGPAVPVDLSPDIFFMHGAAVTNAPALPAAV